MPFFFGKGGEFYTKNGYIALYFHGNELSFSLKKIHSVMPLLPLKLATNQDLANLLK